MTPVDPSRPLLSVRRLKVDYPMQGVLPWHRIGPVRAVNDIHFDLHAGETLGIVGESGCGKSMLARTLAGFQDAVSGSIRFEGRELVGLDSRARLSLRGEIQIVSQNPLAGVRPRTKIADIVAEPLKTLEPELSGTDRQARAAETLAFVGLGAEFLARPASELSAGQVQRVGIARALVVRPKMLICDGPVSSIDVAAQSGVIALLADLQREKGLAMVIIENDLVVARQLTNRVLVMYLGKVMEQGRTDDIYANARHPYTRALLEAAPDLEPVPMKPKRSRLSRGSDQPGRSHPPMGCVYHPRCPLAEHVCVQSAPMLRRVSGEQYAACHFVADNR